MDRLNDAPSDSLFDITLQVIREGERDHPGQATKVLCRDAGGVLAELQVFRNSPVKDTIWEDDAWYLFENISLYGYGEDDIILRAVGETSVKSIDRGDGYEMEDARADTTTTTAETTLLHLSDTHLGRKPYDSEARANDFVEAFVEAIDIGIQRDVDAVVHTGDVTHHDDPEAGLDQRAWNELERLADHDIPFLLIVGNHDLTADGTPQPWLQTAVERGLCRCLGTDPTVLGNVALYGIDYREPSWWQDRDSLQLATPPEGTTPFLCLHQSIAPLAPGDDHIRLSDILRKTDVDLEAVLLGHSHYTQAATVENVLAFYAGATERTTRGYRDEPTVVTELRVGTDIDLTTHSLDTRQFSTYTLVDCDADRDALGERCRQVDPDGEVVTAFVVGDGPDSRTVEHAFKDAGALDAQCYEGMVDPGLESGIYAGDPETLATAEQSLSQTSTVEVADDQEPSTSAEDTSTETVTGRSDESGATTLLHVGSVHLGSANITADRRPEFRAALEEVATIATSQSVDAVVQTGTLFATRTPTDADIQTLRETLERLADAGIKVIHSGSERDYDMDIVDELVSDGLLVRPGPTPTRVGDVAVYGLDPSSQMDIIDQLYEFDTPPAGTETTVLTGSISVKPLTDHGDYDISAVRNQVSQEIDYYFFGDSRTKERTVVRLDTGEEVHVAGPTEQNLRKSDLRDKPRYPCTAGIIGTDGTYEQVPLSHRPLVVYEADCGPDVSVETLLDELDTHDRTVLVRLTGSYHPDRSFDKKTLSERLDAQTRVSKVWDDRKRISGETTTPTDDRIDVMVLAAFGIDEESESSSESPTEVEVEMIQTGTDEPRGETTESELPSGETKTKDSYLTPSLVESAGGKVNPETHYAGADLERAGYATVTETNNGTCGYRLDLTKLSDSQRVTLEGEQWCCPHPAEDGNRCLFHQHSADPEDVRETFLNRLQADERRSTEFVGASLPGITLSNRHLGGEDYEPIDLRFAGVTGAFELDTCVVTTELRLDGARFDDVFDITGGNIRAGLSARETWFQDDFTATFTTLRGRPVVYGSLVEGVAKFHDTEFPNGVTLGKSTYREGLSVDRSVFGAQFSAYEIDAGGPVKAKRAVFDQDVRLAGSSIRDDVSMTRTRCESFIDLSDATFSDGVALDLEASRINSELRLTNATLSALFGERARIRGAVVVGGTSAATINFTEAVFNGGFRRFEKTDATTDHDNNEEVDLRVSGDFVMDAVQLTARSTLECTVGGRCDLSGSRFLAPFELHGELNDLDISATVWEDSPTIGATIVGTLDASEIAVQNNISIESERIDGDVDFSQANIGNRLTCNVSTVTGDLILSATNVNDEIDCREMVVEGTIRVHHATIGGPMRIGRTETSTEQKQPHRTSSLTGDDLEPASNEEGVSAERLSIGQIEFVESQVKSKVELRGSDVDSYRISGGACGELDITNMHAGEVILTDVQVHGRMTCEATQTDRFCLTESLIDAIACHVAPASTEKLVVDARRSTVSDGKITLSDGFVAYDFTRATVGDIELVGLQS